MKSSDFLISTVKEAPNDAKIISHQLMIRAGLISKLASGLYSYLPIGLKIIQKVEKIIREEMNKSMALEIFFLLLKNISLHIISFEAAILEKSRKPPALYLIRS